MTYEDSIKYVHSFSKFGIKPGLDRIKILLNILNNPQKKLKFVHVAGTNGKGSVCAFLSSILTCANLKTGLFTSPHVIDFRERFQINNRFISKKEFVNVVKYIIPYLENTSNLKHEITEFELITVIAFVWFEKNNCDIVVLETGLGGRLDATNIIENSLASVIMSISYDHINILGNNLINIAKEKLGILKPNGKLILYPIQNRQIFQECIVYANKLNNEIIIPDVNLIKNKEINTLSTKFSYKNNNYCIKLLGKHQIINAVTAISVINKLNFNINENQIKLGLSKTNLPSRFEIISENPLIVVDGTHNPGGAKILVNNIQLYLKNKQIIAVTGMLKDKDVKSVMRTVTPFISEFIVTQPNNPRALDKFKLASLISTFNKPCTIAKNVHDALKVAHFRTNVNTAILIFGSFYLSSEARRILCNS